MSYSQLPDQLHVVASEYNDTDKMNTFMLVNNVKQQMEQLRHIQLNRKQEMFCPYA